MWNLITVLEYNKANLVDHLLDADIFKVEAILDYLKKNVLLLIARLVIDNKNVSLRIHHNKEDFWF
jgi:hypothetical protein